MNKWEEMTRVHHRTVINFEAGASLRPADPMTKAGKTTGLAGVENSVAQKAKQYREREETLAGSKPSKDVFEGDERSMETT